MELTHEQTTAVVVGVGAEQGLGAADCRRFAREGHHVLVAGRTSAKIDQTVQTIVNAGGSAQAVLTDATREGDVAGLFDRAVAHGKDLDPVDLVVFNAGNDRRMDFRELSAEAFEEFWRVVCFADAHQASSSGARPPGGWCRSAAGR